MKCHNLENEKVRSGTLTNELFQLRVGIASI